jgi:hypothetical protein
MVLENGRCRCGLFQHLDGGMWVLISGRTFTILEAELPFSVYRVSWLKAKARYCRWKEELVLVRHEMCWVVKWFQGEESEWKRRARESKEAGHKAYAEKKVLLYQCFAKDALQRFQGKMSAM